MTVTEAYRNYREGKFVVNRTYQRKLVWTLDEKVKLIDSILRRYPIPLVLLLQRSDGKYEIIDGMQRLNAILTFIETGFSLSNGLFFNVSEFPTAKDYADNNVFTVIDSPALLSRADCATILDYQLAVTIFTVAEASDVTDIFGRINSGGKQLSPQEQRQAGIVSPFAVFVRQMSSELRGDASADLVNLADMPLVSVDAPTLRLGYGVHAENSFWCKQGVLRVRELRDSMDEEVVADLAASILMRQPFNRSRERLDEAYDPKSALYEELNSSLGAYPAEALAGEIKATFSVLNETIESADSSPNAFRRRVNPEAGGNPVRTPFYAVFMAFHTLVVRQEKHPTDPARIMTSLDGLASRLETASHHVTISERQQNINVVLGLIQGFFAHREPPLLGHGPGLALDFENSLRRSRIETPRYEFKQGLLRLDTRRERDTNIVQRITEVACSMANLGPESRGFIFLGVADKPEDAQRVSQIDQVNPVEVSNRFVVGIDREAARLRISVEEYVRNIVAEIRKSALSDPLKGALLGSLDTISFRGFSVVRITVPPQNAQSWVGDKTFDREGSETIEATGRRITAIASRFPR